MLSNFNEEAQYILLKAHDEMLNLSHPYIGTEHLVLSILKNKNSLSEKLKDYNLTYQNFQTEIISIIGKGTKKSKFMLYTPLLKKVIELSMLDAKDNNSGEVTIYHLFSALLEEGEGIAIRIFIGMGLDVNKMYEEFSNKLITKKKKTNRKLLIEELGNDLTKQAKSNKLDPVIGREKEIQKLIEILCRRTKNNPLLIGEAGVGKTAIIEQLASQIAAGDVPSILENNRIISLDMANVVSGTKYRGEFEERMQKIIKEIEQEENIILFIDEIHTLVGAGGAEGAIDASNILKPALARGKIKCIGATTTQEYKKSIEQDKALNRRFQKIKIVEPTPPQTLNILNNLKPIYEKYHNVRITSDILELIVELTNKYINNRHNPDKSIDILDEVSSKVSIEETSTTKAMKKLKKDLLDISKNKNSLILDNELEKAYKYRKKESSLTTKLNKLVIFNNSHEKIITKEDIAQVINEKTGIPIYEILKDTNESIKKLSTELKNTIIGQNAAITSLVTHTKKVKLGYTSNKVTSYFFTGPTGVGKTALAKAYANILGEKLIRLDASEFSDGTSINKIIGSSPGYIGYQDNNNILEQIKDYPTAIILLDEIDKAHPKIINLLYQILDESQIKDATGTTVNLNNNTIIMTSNIGFEEKTIGFNNKNNIETNLKDKFSPSLVNRIDNIIVFNSLSQSDITIIVKKKLASLKEKYSTFTYTNNLIKDIIKKSGYEIYGARRLDRIIKNELENIIIDKIIANDLPKISSLKNYINN